MPRYLAGFILLDIQFLKGCKVKWKSKSQPLPPAVGTVGPLSDVGAAAAADDDAPRRSNRSPPPYAGVAAKFEDAAFDFTKWDYDWDIYEDGTFPMDLSDSLEILGSRISTTLLLLVLILLNLDCITSPTYAIRSLQGCHSLVAIT